MLALVPVLPLVLIATVAASDDPKPTFEPTDRYESRTVEGWAVLIGPGLREEPNLEGPALDLLRVQLFQVARALPAPALAKLRRVRLWVERDEPHHPCMAYHPSAAWLREHGVNPDKAKAVEVANARNFLDWTKQQPWMVLHELAHAYHHQFLDGGYDNDELREAHKRAITAGLYGDVLYSDGRTRPHYAAKDPMEFFAESSEAYFGTNDFYPFVRAELRWHDPATSRLLKELWDRP